MPLRAPRVCSCGKVVPSGQKCACQKAKAAAYDKQRGSASQRGYGHKWATESKAFLSLPGNQFCSCGCGRPADMVDHIKAPKGDMKLFWDRKNWRALRRGCNSRKAVLFEGGFGRPIRDYTEEPHERR